MVITYSKSMDQPGKVANPTCSRSSSSVQDNAQDAYRIDTYITVQYPLQSSRILAGVHSLLGRAISSGASGTYCRNQ